MTTRIRGDPATKTRHCDDTLHELLLTYLMKCWCYTYELQMMHYKIRGDTAVKPKGLWLYF